MTRTAKILAASVGASFVILLAAGATALAASSTGTLTVTASVAKQCVLNSPTLAFGAYNPSSASPNDNTATLVVSCTKATPYTITMGAGANAAGSLRNMKDTAVGGTDLLNYELYTDSARSTVWNTTNTVGGPGGTASVTVYGRIPVAQYVTPSSYSDSVTATINF